MEKINEDLLKSAIDGDLKGIKMAVKNGADVNTLNSLGQTAMMISVNGNNRYVIIRFLLENGADILAIDNDGKSVKDHLIMPEAPPEHHENAYETWIHCEEHYLSSFLYNEIEEKRKNGKNS